LSTEAGRNGSGAVPAADLAIKHHAADEDHYQGWGQGAAPSLVITRFGLVGNGCVLERKSWRIR
jgi:hypothetical protein